MTDPDEPTESRTELRAEHLLPEERTVGSDDPEQQAAAILADSDEREDHPERTKRDSHQTPN